MKPLDKTRPISIVRLADGAYSYVGPIHDDLSNFRGEPLKFDQYYKAKNYALKHGYILKD